MACELCGGSKKAVVVDSIEPFHSYEIDCPMCEESGNPPSAEKEE